MLEAGHFETRETLLLLQASSFWPSGASSSLKEATYLPGHGPIGIIGTRAAVCLLAVPVSSDLNHVVLTHG